VHDVEGPLKLLSRINPILQWLKRFSWRLSHFSYPVNAANYESCRCTKLIRENSSFIASALRHCPLFLTQGIEVNVSIEANTKKLEYCTVNPSNYYNTNTKVIYTWWQATEISN